MIRAICGLVFVGLLAAGITLTKSGAGLTAVLHAETESEPPATARSGDPFPRRLHCTNGTIQGRFAARTEGSLVGIGPFAAVGVMTFDGFGNLTNAATTSTNGNIVSGVATGTYSVNDDCTGQIAVPSVSNPSGPPLTFNLAIADRGDEIYFIATRAPAVLSGVGKRID
jgi:hypothetical protein